MTATLAIAAGVAHNNPAFAGNVERLRRAALWFVGLSSGFVLIEPSPYEVVIILAVGLFGLTGLKLRAGHLPLIAILTVMMLGNAMGLVPVIALPNTTVWTVVSLFLAISAIFFALAMAENTERRLNALVAGYLASALIVSLIAVLAYLRLIPGSDLFVVLGGRARATFKDPNVLGPFLVLPAVIVMSRLLAGQVRSTIVNCAFLLLMTAAVLLTFSRGAWAVFAGAAVLMMLFSFLTARTGIERLRILALAIVGAAALTLFLVTILSFGNLGEFFQERASLVQSYDFGPLGRFGRHILGGLLIFDYPFGIGPLQFTRYFPEDPHNSFLDAFMAGGWIGGVAYVALMLVTMVFGLRHMFVRSPWQRTYIAFYATFLAILGESYIIDVEHWRHFFLIIGVLWGLMALGTMPREAVYRAA